VKKILTGILAASLSLGIAAAQEKKPATTGNTAGTDPVVIKFGTTEIHKSEFEAAIKSLPQEYQQVANGPAKKMFAEEFVRMKMLAIQGEKNGVQNDPAVRAQLQMVRDNTIANAELQRMQDSLKVSDADLKKAFDAEKTNFEKVTARHILIAPAGSPAAQPGKKEITDEQAKAKAEELRKKVAAGGDFAALAKAESDDTVSGANGGNLGAFGHGDMVPEFEKAAFETKAGDVTVVKTQYGYHVLQVQSHGTATLEEARPQLEGKIKQEMLKKSLEDMKSSSAITYDTTYFVAPEAPTTAAAPEAQPKKDEKKN
jgi:parvulin-like peptidyl-prolyl isomerase